MAYKRMEGSAWSIVTTPVNSVRPVQETHRGDGWTSRILVSLAMAIVVPIVMTQLISSGLRSLQKRGEVEQPVAEVPGRSISSAQVRDGASGAKVPPEEESELSDKDAKRDASEPTPRRVVRSLTGPIADTSSR